MQEDKSNGFRKRVELGACYEYGKPTCVPIKPGRVWLFLSFLLVYTVIPSYIYPDTSESSRQARVKRKNKMLSRPTSLLSLALFILHLASAHRIEIDPGEKECFFEALQPQDRVSYSIT